jgi:hypothetical protein
MPGLSEAPDVSGGVSAGLVLLPGGAEADGRSVCDVGAVLVVVLVGAAVFDAGASGCGVPGGGRTRM